jgi:pimeloyl-ACP methyl ester carboxylesterase
VDPKVAALVYVAARAPMQAFIKYFANGAAQERAEVLYAEQQLTAASLFGGRTTAAAWRSKPSWYAVSKLNRTIAPDLERFLAARMKATTVELEAGHLSLVSHPREIADLILAAAQSNSRTCSSGRMVVGQFPAMQPS